MSIYKNWALIAYDSSNIKATLAAWQVWKARCKTHAPTEIIKLDKLSNTMPIVRHLENYSYETIYLAGMLPDAELVDLVASFTDCTLECLELNKPSNTLSNIVYHAAEIISPAGLQLLFDLPITFTGLDNLISRLELERLTITPSQAMRSKLDE